MAQKILYGNTVSTDSYYTRIVELKDYFSEFLEAQKDQLKSQVRLNNQLCSIIHQMNLTAYNFKAVIPILLRMEEKIDLNAKMLIRLSEEKIQ